MKNFKAIKWIIKELNYILMPAHKKRLVPLAAIMLFTSVLELLGVTIILPFVQAILTPEIVMENKYFKPILDYFNITDAMGVLVFFGICMVFIYIFKNAFIIYSYYYQNDYSTCVLRDLGVNMLSSYMSRPYTFFLDTNIAEIQRGCSQDISGVFTTINALFTIISELLTCIVIGAYIVAAEPVIAIGVVLIMMLTMLIIVAVYKPITKRLSIKNKEAFTESSKALNQTVHGVKDLYVMDRRELFVEAYDKACTKSRIAQRNYNFMSSSPDRIVEAVCVSGMMIVIVVRLVMGVDMTDFIPKMAAFAMAAFKMMPSIGKITSRINTVIYGQIQIDNVYNNMHAAKEYEQELEEYNKAHQSDAVTDDPVNNPRGFEDTLSISNVFWKYNTAKDPVLTGVNIDIHKGEAIGLIGPSGAGKTTLADIILGLFRPQQGGIYLDGVDVYTIPHTWAKIVGYVPQQVFLTDATIRDNVSFGLTDVKDEDIWRALEEASLAEFVKTLPEGLDTVVGDRGVKLSGGQRQRVAIARALYNNPEILILDEATSALDNEVEKAIMESIDALKGNKTLIIVAHRLSTLKNCTHIYEIKDGVATEQNIAEVMARA